MVHGVDSRFAIRVDPGGWGECGSSAVYGDGPVGCFDLVVVEQAQQDAVVSKSLGDPLLEPRVAVPADAVGSWLAQPSGDSCQDVRVSVIVNS